MVQLRPTSYGAVRRLLYDEWVENTRRAVEELSEGTLGYLHIRGMNDIAFRQIFEEISPIEDFTGNLALELTDHRFGDPTMTIDEAKDRDDNYSKPLFVTARFLNRAAERYQGRRERRQVSLSMSHCMQDESFRMKKEFP